MHTLCTNDRKSVLPVQLNLMRLLNPIIFSFRSKLFSVYLISSHEATSKGLFKCTSVFPASHKCLDQEFFSLSFHTVTLLMPVT